MTGIKEKQVLFLAAIIVSLMLHSFLIAALSNINGFEFLKSFSDNIVLTTLVAEKIQAPSHKLKS